MFIFGPLKVNGSLKIIESAILLFTSKNSTKNLILSGLCNNGGTGVLILIKSGLKAVSVADFI